MQGGFKFENQLMEDHFNENYMESTKFPKADFKGFITNINFGSHVISNFIKIARKKTSVFIKNCCFLKFI